MSLRYRPARTSWADLPGETSSSQPALDCSAVNIEAKDQRLISQFEPVMRAGLPVTIQAPVEVHAERLHQLMVAESLLELLDWSQQGTAADPLGCFWLGGLRWFRLLYGHYPADAPAPPQRATDHGLQLLISAGAVKIQPGSGDQAAEGLNSADMAYPSSPAQPELVQDSALLRVLPLALVPYVEESMLNDWTAQLLALTHGSTALTSTAQQLVQTMRSLITETPKDTESVIGDALVPVSAATAELLEPQLYAAAGLSPAASGTVSGGFGDAEQSLLHVVVEHLGQRWRDVTLPA